MSKSIIPFMISGSLLASLLLAGCSSSSTTETGQMDSAQTDQSIEWQSQASDKQQNGRPNMSITSGKIKNISDNTITLYMAERRIPPARTEGEQAPGVAPDDAVPEGRIPKGGSPGGGGRGDRPQGGGMQQSFSEETTNITIDADTKIVAVTFDNGVSQENTISLSDLKADDIIRYTLKSDSNVAESITLSSGNPGSTRPDNGTDSST
jgi:hypothetical protein